MRGGRNDKSGQGVEFFGGVIEVQNLRDIKEVGFGQEIIEAPFILGDGLDFKDEGFACILSLNRESKRSMDCMLRYAFTLRFASFERM